MARCKAGLQTIVREPTFGGFKATVEPRPVCWLEVSLQPSPEGGATSLGHMHKDESLSVKAIVLWACELGVGIAALMEALMLLMMIMMMMMLGVPNQNWLEGQLCSVFVLLSQFLRSSKGARLPVRLLTS